MSFFRSLWCLSVIGSCILCGVLVYPIYSKWQNTPTITSVEETNYAIWNIYFPAVTVCSNNKVVESQIESLLKLQPWKNISKEDENFEINFRDAIKGKHFWQNLCLYFLRLLQNKKSFLTQKLGFEF